MKRIALLLCLAALLSAALASDADPYRDIATDIASAARALPGKTIAVMPFETAMGADAGFARFFHTGCSWSRAADSGRSAAAATGRATEGNEANKDALVLRFLRFLL